MQAFLDQAQKLPAVWLPFVLALGLATTFIWKLVEHLYKIRSEAHTADKAATQAKLDLLETQLAELRRSASQSQFSARNELSSALDAKIRKHPTSPPDADKRQVYVPESITPQFLLAKKRGQTNYQGAIRVAPYAGKWMRLTGTLVEVLHPKGRDSLTVFIRSDSMGEPEFLNIMTSDVIATFDGQPEDLKVARIGDSVRLIGMIDNVDQDAVVLIHCSREQA